VLAAADEKVSAGQKIGLEESFMLKRFSVLPLLHSQGHA
jgi:hypothetical protein